MVILLPRRPGGNDYYTRMLLHCDGADESTTFDDYSKRNQSVTAYGNAQVDTAYAKFGTGSLILARNATDYLKINDDTDFQFVSGANNIPFTIDLQLRYSTLPSTASDWDVLFRQYVDANNYQIFGIYNDASNLKLKYKVVSASSTIIEITSSVISPANGIWEHYAVVRDASDNYYLFHKGVLVGSGLDSSVLPDFAGDAYIGSHNAGSSEFYSPAGNIDEFRISHIDRWTHDFAPPSRAYAPYDYY